MLRICCQDHLNESLSKLLFMTCSSFSIQPPFVLSPIDRSCIPRVAWEQPTFRNVTIGFPAKWRLRNERRNSTVTTCYCLDRNASDWFKQISLVARPVRSTAAIRVVTRHQYGICTSLVPQTSFRGETSGGVAKCRLVSMSTSRGLRWQNPVIRLCNCL